MKNILCLIDGLGFGGAQRQIIGLTQYLQEKGYQVTLASYHKRDFYNDLLNRLNIRYSLIETSNKWSKLFSVRKFIKKGNYDVVITYQDGPNIIGCLLKLSGLKYKLIVSERITSQQVGKKERIKFNLYRIADYIVPNSFSQEKFIKDHFSFLSHKTYPITNYTETGYFTPEQHENGQSKRKILIAGRISKQKNLPTFLDAVKILKDKQAPVKISWFGNVGVGMKDYHDAVISKYNLLDLGDYLQFYPGTSNIKEEYLACDAFCLPSLYEGFPNVVCEAMSCGKPILCSNVCDNPHLVKDGENGFLFDPKSPEDIAAAILKFCDLNPEEIKRMGECSRKKVVELCSTETFVQKYIKLIEE